ncbi:MAG: aminotransferase class V-fold PLP-dependent enzyme [Lachnospiraceae bacterium]
MIYFDNASTTFPKPKAVPDAMYEYMTEVGSNINRGCYNNAYQVEEIVYETRQMLCDLFGGDDCRQVAFTKNVTESLNVILKGFLKPGDHIITSSMEHNAVMRPLVQLKQKGVTFSRVICDEEGVLDVNKLDELLQPNTKAVVMTHGSNVCGTILPIKEVGEWCRKHHLRFFVDSAQTAGVYPINMKEMHIDALAFTGHKGLLGPQGIGGFILGRDMAGELEPLLSGGTGSISHKEEVPNFMPDRFEAGTMNLPGIIGLHAALEWLEKTGLDTICRHELSLTKQFLEGLAQIDQSKIRIIGKKNIEGRTGVVSIQTIGKDLSEVAYALDSQYEIMTRVGLHCAPSAHKTLGTYPTGTIRFAFGWWNRPEEVESAIYALREILAKSL